MPNKRTACRGRACTYLPACGPSSKAQSCVNRHVGISLHVRACTGEDGRVVAARRPSRRASECVCACMHRSGGAQNAQLPSPAHARTRTHTRTQAHPPVAVDRNVHGGHQHGHLADHCRVEESPQDEDHHEKGPLVVVVRRDVIAHLEARWLVEGACPCVGMDARVRLHLGTPIPGAVRPCWVVVHPSLLQAFTAVVSRPMPQSSTNTYCSCCCHG